MQQLKFNTIRSKSDLDERRSVIMDELLAKDEIKALKKVYNKAKENANLATLIAYDELFKKISSYIQDEEMREAFLGISILKYYDLDLIKQLKLDCEQKSTVEILYKKPTSKNEVQKEVIIQKIEAKNDKIYIYCYDKNNDFQLMLNLNRLIKIISRKFEKGNINLKTTKIKFLVKNIANITLENDENISDDLLARQQENQANIDSQTAVVNEVKVKISENEDAITSQQATITSDKSDIDAIKKAVEEKPRMVYIQRRFNRIRPI